MSNNICDDELQIIYKNGQPKGIRDRRGFLFFFTKVYEYSGQGKRYRDEVDQLNRLADFLLKTLKDEQDKVE